MVKYCSCYNKDKSIEEYYPNILISIPTNQNCWTIRRTTGCIRALKGQSACILGRMVTICKYIKIGLFLKFLHVKLRLNIAWIGLHISSNKYYILIQFSGKQHNTKCGQQYFFLLESSGKVLFSTDNFSWNIHLKDLKR